MSGPTHYDVLGVQPDATTDDIRRAYRKVQRSVHPDVAPASMAGLATLVNLAYQVLMDPAARAAYDAELAGPAPAAEPEPVEVVVEETFEEWVPEDEPEASPGAPIPADPSSPVEPGEWRPERITPRSWPWWSLLIAPVVSVGLIVLAGPNLVPLLLLAPVAAGVGLWREPPGIVTKAFWVAVAALLALQVVGFSSTDTSQTSMILGGAGALAALAGHLVARAWSRDRGYYSGRLPTRMARHLEFGSPGLRPDQQRTAATLRQVVAQVPGVRLLHRVQVGDVVIDHVLIAGSRLALFSNQVAGGHVVVDQWGEVLVDGTPLGLDLAGHRSAIVQTPYETPVKVSASGWVVFTGARSASSPTERVGVATDTDLSAQVLAWLAENHTGLVDRRLLLWAAMATRAVHA